MLNYKDDNHNLQIKKTMNNKNDNIIILDNEDRIAMRSRMYKLGNYIYENFKDLINYKNLNHSQNEINRLLMSQNVILFLYLVDNKIEGYLVCETTGCNVFFINYIYVVNKYRGHKIGSQFMSSAISTISLRSRIRCLVFPSRRKISSWSPRERIPLLPLALRQ